MQYLINNPLKIYVTVLVIIIATTFYIGRATAPSQPKLIDGDSVTITYSYNYDRLTPATCTTDFECETADLLTKNAEGKLFEVPQPPVYEPVIEPIDCAKGDLQCQKDNRLAGEPVTVPALTK